MLIQRLAIAVSSTNAAQHTAVSTDTALFKNLYEAAVNDSGLASSSIIELCNVPERRPSSQYDASCVSFACTRHKPRVAYVTPHTFDGRYALSFEDIVHLYSKTLHEQHIAGSCEALA
eukprot:1067-Heterococcus_DN1.PRE.2